jgi:hypothetical protein
MSAGLGRPNPFIAGHHSRTAYAYAKKDLHAIVRTVAYHRKDFDLAVTWFPPSVYSGVASSLAADYRKPRSPLGTLDTLPLELITNICLQLDIQSVFRLRQVNARGQQIVNTLHEYRVIIKHALNAFLALLRTRKTPGVTLQEFYSLLCTQECSLCGGYGDLVYLLTWIRCCSSCLHANNAATRTGSFRLVKQLKLSKDSLHHLPRLKNIKGHYTMAMLPLKRRTTYVPLQQVEAAYHEEYGGKPIPVWFGTIAECRKAFSSCCALATYDPRSSQVEYGLSCAGCQVFAQDVCSRLYRKWAHLVRDMVYSHSGYLEHFAWCEQAQRLWEDSGQGTKVPEGLPSHYTSGGYFKEDGFRISRRNTRF